jgi:V/A-type H+-transporting ATPase subunit A
VTLISAISPPGGDFSEPVTQASLRVVGALWALDPALAHQRQFPAVDWDVSYSLQADALAPWFAEHVGADWDACRRRTLDLMQRERELREIAGLVGPEALQDRDRLLLEAARIVRETVLGQSAYDPHDAASPVEKTYRLATLADALYRAALAALDAGVAFESLDLTTVGRTWRRCAGHRRRDGGGATAAEAAISGLAPRGGDH